jgi:hypothetical protein
MEDLKQLIEAALHGCYLGKMTNALKTLYKAPYRDMVDWTQFPSWARIDAETEMGHEG